ncbi:MAG: DNA-directed RNA polymerase subunit beta', partial [Anaerolineales bacterium]|nr:DNA-directed RNA polymerase subunit beta' [Anaerolineales bacterium]
NEQRRLQLAVDALFDNSRCDKPVRSSANRQLKSLTDLIQGKHGRFRENLLGKRVDYSGRAVIVINPRLRYHQCGLPRKIALELYQPFIIRKLKECGLANTIKSAKKMLERRDQEVWDILEEVMNNHPVLLNRAPTLHRLSIQAFEPVLVEGKAIHIHPLVCAGFNADADGDQMAVHLPLSIEAQTEAHVLMMSTHNLFSPTNGKMIVSLSQDIAMGVFYLTCDYEPQRSEPSAVRRVFSHPHEAMMAHQCGRLGLHEKILCRVSRERVVTAAGGTANPVPPNRILETTVGRLIFNDILAPEMAFHNHPLKQKDTLQLAANCYDMLGREACIDLLDAIKELGFTWSTLAGLSICMDDMRIPAAKPRLIADAQKQVDRFEGEFRQGLITREELGKARADVWWGAGEQITREMMNELKNDYRDDHGDYVPITGEQGRRRLNPIFLMADSGARGSVGQIQQLAGMRGLMTKPSGEIIETPIKRNFREGLSVLEYFSSTHGARKGLVDTANKTSDSGYLTRKLAHVAQSVTVNEYDCGTITGIAKETIYKGKEVAVPLREIIVGRTACDSIRSPITDQLIVVENAPITLDAAAQIEELGLDTMRVRSPLTCESPRGVCALCYGIDMSTGSMVEEGMAVGIIAAQSIGEPGTQLTMRTFHTGGVATQAVVEREIHNSLPGVIAFYGLNAVDVPAKGDIPARTTVLKRNGEIAVVDAKGCELERFKVPYGAEILVKAGQEVAPRTQLARWNPHLTPILAEKAGFVRFHDITEGETVRLEQERQDAKFVVIEHRGHKHPQIIIEDREGKVLGYHYLPAKTRIEVIEGDEILPGMLLARQPPAMIGTQDITGSLPRVTEIFEARKPRKPAVMAEISGEVEIVADKRRGKMTIVVKSEGGMTKEHPVPQDKQLLVHAGDRVEAGDPLVDGPLVPHDILRIKGEEALVAYLLAEVQAVYRSQNVTINDKHVEIILRQMLRKVKIDNPGDSEFLPGEVVDKFRFRAENNVLDHSVKIKDPGDSKLEIGAILPQAEFDALVLKIEEEGGMQPTRDRKLRRATAKPLLLGITKASLGSESFISAAAFQQTIKVLIEASISGATDELAGLNERVTLGRLIPAGTGFCRYRNIRISRAATTPEAADGP